MARNAKKGTSDSEIDSDEEIWKTIGHLDPDRGHPRSAEYDVTLPQAV
jgi:hypothetical protein